MIDIQTQTRMQADASFTVGNRVFHVVCEVSTIRGLGGKAGGTIVSPTALLVDEGGRFYSVSLGGEDMGVEEILRLIPSLKEKTRQVRDVEKDQTGDPESRSSAILS